MNISSEYIEKIVSNNDLIHYILTCTIVVILVNIFIKSLRTLFTTYQDSIWKRNINKYKYIMSVLKDDSPTRAYLNEVLELEAFRLLTGVWCSKEQAKFLMAIGKDGLLKPNEISGVSYYINVEDSKASISTNNIDKSIFLWSQFTVCILFLSGFISTSTLMLIGGFSNFLLGITLLILCLGLIPIFGRDYFLSLTLTRLKKQLESRDLLINPDVKIRWRIRDLINKFKSRVTPTSSADSKKR